VGSLFRLVKNENTHEFTSAVKNMRNMLAIA